MSWHSFMSLLYATILSCQSFFFSLNKSIKIDNSGCIEPMTKDLEGIDHNIRLINIPKLI